MPALGGVYKLAAVYEDGKEIPKIKLSDTTEKITNPGVKEVCRFYDKKTGKAIADYIMRAGKRWIRKSRSPFSTRWTHGSV